MLPEPLVGIPIIFLHGKQKAGKTTLADAFLSQHGSWQRMSFAGPMKQGLAMMGIDTDDYSPDKDRFTLQFIGVWFRENKGTNWWVDLLEKRIHEEQARHTTRKAQLFRGLLIDDLRFPNEFALATKLTNEYNYPTYRVKIEVSEKVQAERGAAMDRMNHISETALDDVDPTYWDMIIPEDSTVEQRVQWLHQLASSG